MTKKKTITGIVLSIVLILVILAGIRHYKTLSSQPDELSANSAILTKASAKPYSRTNSSSNNSGEVDHIGKIMEHLGL